MDTESIVRHCDRTLLQRTGRRLNHVQRLVLQQVYQGQKYREIADEAGYTEGHIKDVGSDLWKLLSQAFDTKFTKSNCKTVIKRSLQSAGLYKPGQFVPPIGDAYRSGQTPEVMPLDWDEMAGDFDACSEVSPRPDPQFMGRAIALTQLHQYVQQGHPIIVIQGAGGLGKTTLAQHFLHQPGLHQPGLHQQPYDVVIELLMAKETQHITPADRVVAEWLKQDFGVEPGTDFGVSLGRLQRQLQQRRVGILIDNLEPALDAQGTFLPEHRQYLELLRVLSLPRTQGTTLITSRDRLGEVDANLVHYRLPGLSPETWIEFFRQTGDDVDGAIVQQLCHAYGGNAKAMGLIWGTVQTDFDRDLAAYWQNHQSTQLLETDLAQLVLSQIQRLQQLDPAAAQLLCRLSCYRYQAVARLPNAALSRLLWDLPAAAHPAVIKSLQSRSLLEFHKGQYWLHPVVREVAITKLRQTPDWERANTAAASFWTEHITQIQTKQDAIAALEAYHHHIAISDYANAAAVILKSRHNQWQQHLPLGCTLYRMGFVAPVIAAIATVIPQVTAPIQRAELHNILGDLQWIAGKITSAIDCQNQTIALTELALSPTHFATENAHQQYCLKMLKVDSLLSLGLYHIDLWELSIAADRFEQVIAEAQGTAHDRWAQKAQICLAYVLVQQGELSRSRELADRVALGTTTEPSQSGSFAYFWQILGQTYTQLGDTETAQTLFTQALASAETGEYPQIKARTLNSLAQLHRQQGEIDYAMMLHTEAIDLLDRIGAQCDLAEAHWQCGLTAQGGGAVDSAQQQFETAQNLFAAIPAPQQLARIKTHNPL